MIVAIDKLRAIIIEKWPDIKKTVPLEDTPHYKYLDGDKEKYIEYLDMVDQPDHSVEKYERLIKEFNYDDHEKIKCRPDGGTYIILDGIHRACIYLYNKNDEIEIA